MVDICIRFINPNGSWYSANKEDIEKYHKWLKKNLPKDHFYIPSNADNYVYFADEADLLAFTMKFGKDIYRRGKPAGPSRVERMIMQEEILERTKRTYEKSSD